MQIVKGGAHARHSISDQAWCRLLRSNGCARGLVIFLERETRKKSLKTKDKAEAKRRLWPIIAEWQHEFEDLRARRSLVDADREHAVWDHYTSFLELDDVERSSRPGQAEVELVKADAIARAERGEIKGIDPLTLLDVRLDLLVAQKADEVSSLARRIKLAEMKKHLSNGETALIANAVDDYLRQNRLFVERSTPDWVSLARRMMRAESERHRAASGKFPRSRQGRSSIHR